MMDVDDVGVMFFLHPVFLIPIILIIIGVAIWWGGKDDNERMAYCIAKADKLGMEGMYIPDHDCVVKIGPNKWQDINKYSESGIVIKKD